MDSCGGECLPLGTPPDCETCHPSCRGAANLCPDSGTDDGCGGYCKGTNTNPTCHHCTGPNDPLCQPDIWADPTFLGESYFSPLVPPQAPSVPVFSPGNLSGHTTFTLHYTVKYASTSVTILIADSNSAIVRALKLNDTELQGMQSAIWDGKSDQGALLPEGLYTYSIVEQNLQNITQTFSVQGSVAIDNTPPQASISGFQEDAANPLMIDVIGTAADLHLSSYTLTASTPLNAGFRSVTGNILGLASQWDRPNGHIRCSSGPVTRRVFKAQPPLIW